MRFAHSSLRVADEETKSNEEGQGRVYPCQGPKPKPM
jgi:hypothetical protein